MKNKSKPFTQKVNLSLTFHYERVNGFRLKKRTVHSPFKCSAKKEGIAKKNNKGSRKDDPQGNNFPWGEKVSFASKGTIIVPLNPCRIQIGCFGIDA